jgi:hypothetical protein
VAPPKLCESSCQTGEPTAIVLQAPPQGGSAAATPQGSSSIIATYLRLGLQSCVTFHYKQRRRGGSLRSAARQRRWLAALLRVPWAVGQGQSLPLRSVARVRGRRGRRRGGAAGVGWLVGWPAPRSALRPCPCRPLPDLPL